MFNAKIKITSGYFKDAIWEIKNGYCEGGSYQWKSMEHFCEEVKTPFEILSTESLVYSIFDLEKGKIYKEINTTGLWKRKDNNQLMISKGGLWKNYTGAFATLAFKTFVEETHSLPIDLPLDSRIKVSTDGVVWHRAYFAGFEEGLIMVYANQRTSWTEKEVVPYKYGKVVDNED